MFLNEVFVFNKVLFLNLKKINLTKKKFQKKITIK